jgi:PPOX class probable FMN-dependent enzyme
MLFFGRPRRNPVEARLGIIFTITVIRATGQSQQNPHYCLRYPSPELTAPEGDTMIDHMTYLTDVSELRPLYQNPPPMVLEKQIDWIDPHCRDFIARSPLVIVGSLHPKRGMDVSPRGDPPGFVRVLDEHHLAIPDRPGNNRLDTMENLIANPAIGLLFVIPGIGDVLRINGTARLTRAEPLLESMAANGKRPKLAIVVSVSEVLLHCARALMRARLWANDYRVERSQLPTLGRMIVEQAKSTALTAEEADARINAAYQNLY